MENQVENPVENAVENPSAGFVVESPPGFWHTKDPRSPKAKAHPKNARSVFTKKPADGFSTGFSTGFPWGFSTGEDSYFTRLRGKKR